MNAVEPRVHLEIGSRFENVELVQIAVAASLEQLAVDAETARSIGSAVREAVANAIQHGNALDPEKRVEIEFGLEGDEVVIQVRDEGRGFDPDAVPDPRSPENLLKPAGRGIFFMKRYMDAIDYSFDPGRGTVLTLRKRVSRAPAANSQRQEEEA